MNSIRPFLLRGVQGKDEHRFFFSCLFLFRSTPFLTRSSGLSSPDLKGQGGMENTLNFRVEPLYLLVFHGCANGRTPATVNKAQTCLALLLASTNPGRAGQTQTCFPGSGFSFACI